MQKFLSRFNQFKFKTNLKKIFDPEKMQKKMGTAPLSVGIITCLHKKDMHGYEIHKQFQILPKPPSYGQLYPLLHKMQKVGLIKSHKEDRRKVYSLTSEGHKAYKEVKKMMQFSIGFQLILYNEMFGEKYR